MPTPTKIVAVALVLLVAAVAAAKSPPPKKKASSSGPPDRYVVVVRGIDDKSNKSGILEEARELLLEELKKHPELAEAPSDMASVEAIRAKNLKSVSVQMYITKVTRELAPPPPGKPMRVLTRGIRVSIVGDTMPDKLVAITGEGEAEVGEDVGKNDDLDKIGKKLLIETAKDAIAQAVEKMVKKLKLATAGK